MTGGTQTSGDADFADLVARWDALAGGAETGGPETGGPETGGTALGDARLAWLHDALDAAIKLEFSTIPPYLCALWSIEDQSSPVADSIRRIVQEEMLHMALACNMLVAVGGTPRIHEPGFAPVYPGKLAGGVHPDLTVGLGPLSPEALRAFMIIELPEVSDDPATKHLRDAAGIDFDREGHATIGEFYDRLEAAFAAIDPEFSMDRQIAGPLAWFPVRDLADVREAVSLIKHQGEGSDKAPTEYEDGPPEMAHFYRFLEIHVGRRIVHTLGPEGGRWDFGEAIAAPAVAPMAPVPPGGWPGNGPSAPPEAVSLLDAFDAAYTRLLDELGHLWAEGDQGRLIHAIEAMFALQAPARALMRIPVPGRADGATYGPCFRYRPEPA